MGQYADEANSRDTQRGFEREQKGARADTSGASCREDGAQRNGWQVPDTRYSPLPAGIFPQSACNVASSVRISAQVLLPP